MTIKFNLKNVGPDYYNTLYWWHNHRKTMTNHKTWTAFVTKLFCKHAESKFACVKSNCTTVLITTLRIFRTHFENIFRLKENKTEWIVMRKQILHKIIERFQIWNLTHWRPIISYRNQSMDLFCQSIYWFPFERDIECLNYTVNKKINFPIQAKLSCDLFWTCRKNC